MTARRLLAWLASARATVTLLSVLAVLLLLGVLLPQRRVIGEEAWARALESGGWRRLVLEGLGLGEMPTSPVFLAVLAAFFLNLAVVIASRVGPTWRRASVKPRAEAGLIAWAASRDGRSARRPPGLDARGAARVLRGFGYSPRILSERTAWGVKHRTAAFGFLLFHASFFLICAGGVLLWYTRFTGTIWLSEGQTFAGNWTAIDRVPPGGSPPALDVTLERVDAVFEGGDPLHLGARFRFGSGPSSIVRESRVNHPAELGSLSLLVGQAGLSPVLWLQDAGGGTVDRVVSPVKTRGEQVTDIPLAGGRLVARFHSLGGGADFPSRDELARVVLRCEVLRDGVVVFDGSLRPGDAAPLPEGRLVLEGLRFWVGARVVDERGGGLLVAGFVLGVAGLVWRLPLCRREIVVHLDGDVLRMAGSSEYFTSRFEDEMAAVCGMLARDDEPASPGGKAQS